MSLDYDTSDQYDTAFGYDEDDAAPVAVLASPGRRTAHAATMLRYAVVSTLDRRIFPSYLSRTITWE